MEFDYKGKTYDTDSSAIIFTTTEDHSFKLALITKWTGESKTFETEKELDLTYELCLLEAKSESIIDEVTGGELSYPGSYPSFVIDSFNRLYADKAIELDDVVDLLSENDDKDNYEDQIYWLKNELKERVAERKEELAEIHKWLEKGKK